MTITPEQHQVHLKQLAYFQHKVEELTRLTRQYVYEHEAERVVNRKKDSEEYYKQVNKEQ